MGKSPFLRWMTGWWLSPTPLKNDGVSQLGWWHSQYMEKWKMFQTTHQMKWFEQKRLIIGKIRKCIDTIDIPFGNQTWRRLQNPLMIFSLKPPFSWEGGWMLCGTSVSKAECWLRDWAIAATPRQLKWVWQWPLKMHSTTDMALSYSWLRHIHKYRLMFTLYSKESHPYHSKISPNSHKHWRLGFCPLEVTPSGKKKRWFYSTFWAIKATNKHNES